MSLRFDAVVVGGGPAGAAAATFLSRAGWSIALVEKTGFPRPKVCGEFLSATNLALLDQLGMKQTFVGRAGPEIKRVGVFVGKTALVAPMPAGCDRDYRWGRALGRDVFDAWLLELAKEAGTQVWQPFVVTSIHRRDGGFVC